jgi:hypothetical protein
MKKFNRHVLAPLAAHEIPIRHSPGAARPPEMPHFKK